MKYSTMFFCGTFLFAGVSGLALADDDDDGKRGKLHHRGECKVLMIEATADQTLIVTGKYLLQRSRKGTKRPKVWFGGILAPVLEDPEPTSTQIVIDVSAALEGVTAPKDFLLEIKRSRHDGECDDRLVTVIPPEIACPLACADGIEAWKNAILSEFIPNPPVFESGDAYCRFDPDRQAGSVNFGDHFITPGPAYHPVALRAADNGCRAELLNPPPNFEHIVFVDLDDLTDAEQAACAPLAKAALIELDVTTDQECVITPP